MPELRWTLLILGALFIGVLAFWEIRRKRHARGQDPNAPASRDGERVSPTLDEGDAPARAAAPEKPRGNIRSQREPTLTFPDVHLDARGDRASVARPPVVEIDEASLADLKIEPHTVVDEFSATDRSRASDEALGLAPTIPVAPGTPRAPSSPLPGTSSTGPRLASPPPARASAAPDVREPPRLEDTDLSFAKDPSFDTDSSFDRDPSFDRRASFDREASLDRDGSFDTSSSPDASSSLGSPSEPRASSHPDSSRREPSAAQTDDALTVASPSNADSEVLGPALVRKASTPSLPPGAFEQPKPIVDWPDDSTRKIIALRLVSSSGERFQGRAVRQALAAEGFQIGKFEIFHKPGPDARAVLSVASLTKPGTFALNTMDGQRYGGLSLFAVLPGPLSPVETFDELLLTARSLNDRLRGALQDERGEPLTPTRSASIRESLASSSSPTPH